MAHRRNEGKYLMSFHDTTITNLQIAIIERLAANTSLQLFVSISKRYIWWSASHVRL